MLFSEFTIVNTSTTKHTEVEIDLQFLSTRLIQPEVIWFLEDFVPFMPVKEGKYLDPYEEDNHILPVVMRPQQQIRLALVFMQVSIRLEEGEWFEHKEVYGAEEDKLEVIVRTLNKHRSGQLTPFWITAESFPLIKDWRVVKEDE